KKRNVAYKPWSLTRELKHLAARPSGTLLVLPHGKVKVCAALPLICADVRTDGLLRAWCALQRAGLAAGAPGARAAGAAACADRARKRFGLRGNSGRRGGSSSSAGMRRSDG